MIQNLIKNSTYVVGDSMYPLIKSGDKVYYQKHTGGACLGDIIIFYEDNRLVIHRIIRIKNKMIQTKGDNSLFIDKRISRSRVLGRAIKIESSDGEINLDSAASRLLKYYFLLHSLIPYGIVKIVYKLNSKFLYLRILFRKLLLNQIPK